MSDARSLRSPPSSFGRATSLLAAVATLCSVGCSHVRPGVFIDDEVEPDAAPFSEPVAIAILDEDAVDEEDSRYPTFFRGVITAAADDVFPAHSLVSDPAQADENVRVVVESFDVEHAELLFGDEFTVEVDGYVEKGGKKTTLRSSHTVEGGFEAYHGFLIGQGVFGGLSIVTMFVPFVGTFLASMMGTMGILGVDNNIARLQLLLDRAYSGAAIKFLDDARYELAGHRKKRRKSSQGKKKQRRKKRAKARRDDTAADRDESRHDDDEEFEAD